MFNPKEDYTPVREGIPKIESLKKITSRLHEVIPPEGITIGDRRTLEEIQATTSAFDRELTNNEVLGSRVNDISMREGIPKSKIESLRETTSRLRVVIPPEGITPEDRINLSEMGGIVNEMDRQIDEILESYSHLEPVPVNYPRPEEIPEYKPPSIVSPGWWARFRPLGGGSRKP